MVIFNHRTKRSSASRRLDNWEGDFQLNGNPIKIVNSIRYLGSWLDDKLSAKKHISKKRSAAYCSYNRVKKLGISSVHSGCYLKGNMYKVYVRTVALYEIENFNLTENEINKLSATEKQILKKMMGLTKICQSKDLFRSLGIELTEQRYKIAKLKFMLRIKSKSFTEKLYEELNKLNVRNSFPD